LAAVKQTERKSLLEQLLGFCIGSWFDFAAAEEVTRKFKVVV
jgi:hypothetical protein